MSLIYPFPWNNIAVESQTVLTIPLPYPNRFRTSRIIDVDPDSFPDELSHFRVYLSYRILINAYNVYRTLTVSQSMLTVSPDVDSYRYRTVEPSSHTLF